MHFIVHWRKAHTESISISSCFEIFLYNYAGNKCGYFSASSLVHLPSSGKGYIFIVHPPVTAHCYKSHNWHFALWKNGQIKSSLSLPRCIFPYCHKELLLFSIQRAYNAKKNMRMSIILLGTAGISPLDKEFFCQWKTLHQCVSDNIICYEVFNWIAD